MRQMLKLTISAACSQGNLCEIKNRTITVAAQKALSLSRFGAYK